MNRGEMQATVRPAEPSDTAQILALLAASMEWPVDDLHERFFHWKHVENPFGASPSWVALDPHDNSSIVGFRTFLRWEFDHAGTSLRAVRAVDTATHPAFQGRGIFSSLTRTALDSLHAEGVDLVFNTPNERSLPGYLKMGWKVLERVPIAVRPRTLVAIAKLASARVPADKWSLPTNVGESASEVFTDQHATDALLAALPSSGLVTRRTGAFLAWRYGFAELHYRVLLATDRLGGGGLVFRLRRRGSAIEAAIVDELVPVDAARGVAALARRLPRLAGADYAVRVRGMSWRGFVPLPKVGPTLTVRPVVRSQTPPARDWRLSLGDVELF